MLPDLDFRNSFHLARFEEGVVLKAELFICCYLLPDLWRPKFKVDISAIEYFYASNMRLVLIVVAGLMAILSSSAFSQVGSGERSSGGNSPAGVNTFASSLVVIEGNKGKGTGFIGFLNDKPVIFTNSHVLKGNTRIDVRSLTGQKLDFNKLMLAESYDLSVLYQDTVNNGLQILENVDSNVAIGDDVIVIGNSLGGGVVSEIKGKVIGIGPELVEIDAKFVVGNSGSPIIHVKTGKVIGIATFISMRELDWAGRDSKFHRKVRRFGYRVDNVPMWHELSLSKFIDETCIINDLERRTEDIWNLAIDIADDGKVSQWSLHLQKGNYLEMLIATWQRELGKGRTASSSHLLQEKKRLLAGVISGLRNDMAFLKADRFTAYNRKVYENIVKERHLLTEYFRILDAQLSTDPLFLTR